MKTLLTNNIGPGKAQPVKKGTLIFLQDAYTEMLSAMAKRICGGTNYDSTKMYVLDGCKNLGDTVNYNVEAGVIFFNGKMYTVNAIAFTITGANVPVATITPSFTMGAPYDPVIFTDGSSHNVHQTESVILSNAASGTGDGNYLNWIFLNRWDISAVVPVGTLVGVCTGTVTGVFFNWKLGDGMCHLTYIIGLNITVSAATMSVTVPMPSPIRNPVSGFPSATASALMTTTTPEYRVGSCLISGLFVPANNGKLIFQFYDAPGVGNISIQGQINYEI